MNLLYQLTSSRVETLANTVDAWKQEHSHALVAFDMEDLTAECIRLADAVVTYWETTKARLPDAQLSELEAIGQRLRILFERFATVVASTDRVVRAFEADTGHKIGNLVNLRSAQIRTETLWTTIEAAWPWDARPMPPLDRALAERSKAAFAAGQGKPLSQLIAEVSRGDALS